MMTKAIYRSIEDYEEIMIFRKWHQKQLFNSLVLDSPFVIIYLSCNKLSPRLSAEACEETFPVETTAAAWPWHNEILLEEALVVGAFKVPYALTVDA